MKKKILIIGIIALALIIIVFLKTKKMEPNIAPAVQPNAITFTQYEAGSSNKIKEMQITSSEDIEQVEQFVKKLHPLSDREMVDLALLQEVEIQYGDFISIGVQLGESQYCYYINKNENISSLAKMPKGLYEWICEKIN